MMGGGYYCNPEQYWDDHRGVIYELDIAYINSCQYQRICTGEGNTGHAWIRYLRAAIHREIARGEFFVEWVDIAGKNPVIEEWQDHYDYYSSSKGIKIAGNDCPIWWSATKYRPDDFEEFNQGFPNYIAMVGIREYTRGEG